ncbi:MAG: hypothetical protein ABI792_02085 [bacterium]
MIKKLIMPVFICIIIAIFSSCGDNNKNKISTAKDSVQSPNTNTPKDTVKSNTTVNKNRDEQNQTVKTAGTIRINFPDGATQMILMNNINGLNDNITYVLEARKGQKLTASLSTLGGLGNIRFNQIIDPSGKADGPFSREMTYDFNQSGDWKLVVGESNMLSEPYIGNYKFKIGIK